MLHKIIFYLFCILFFLTPLFWIQYNFELFEYNKMILVYTLTILITATWALDCLNRKTLIFNRTPLDIPILLFLAANILSTIFSIDIHTSIWGYYSRSNGGLLSTISYILLFFAFVSNFKKDEALSLLKVALAGGAAVALYAIPEHFGISPSCVVLGRGANASCWIQDVQSRVFATLGQPNWLAAYIGMLIFPAFYFLLNATKKSSLATYYLLLTTYYLAFTFTFSRGATFGLLAGLVVFLSQFFLGQILELGKKIDLKLAFYVLGIFLFINIIYGSALTRFQLTSLLPKTQQVNITPQKAAPPQLTQLENGGTESGKIRLIVWQGALDIFKHYPIFGSGVETFAYSYYQFRPTSHNLVSEWDFLYNKAHNEFLNYLATIGLIGFTTYMFLIISFIYWSINKILFEKQKTANSYSLLAISFLSSYIFYLVQNVFGFSVVIIALFFFLFPGFSFVISESVWPHQIDKNKTVAFRFIYSGVISNTLGKIIVVVIALFFMFIIIRFWAADVFFASGEREMDNGQPINAYNNLSEAVSLNTGEPYYSSELAYSAAASALAYGATNTKVSGELEKQAIDLTQKVLQENPKNVSYARTAIRTYYLLSTINPKLTNTTLTEIDNAIKLAPTDPKLYYNKAIILGQINQNKQAIALLEQALKLKNNYREGYFALSLFYFDEATAQKSAGNLDSSTKYEKLSVDTMNKVLQLVPNDPDAIQQLNTWGKKGVATSSAISR